MNFAVTILGSNSALPAHGRHPTAQVVTFRDRLFLVDCGEGTQMRLNDYRVHPGRISHIFISHLHGDHYFGLIGLLNTFGLRGRTQPLGIFAPAPLQDILTVQLAAADTRLPYPLIFHALEPGRAAVVLSQEDMEVTTFPTNHRIDCFGFSFRERHAARRLDPEAARLHDIPAAFFRRLQAGEDYVAPDGGRVPNGAVTRDPAPSRRYVFCADTRYDESLLPFVGGADLVYHEATYLEEDRENAFRRYHSTAREAASLARKAGAKKLLIGHFSSKYPELHPFLEESQPVFGATELAVEGASYPV